MAYQGIPSSGLLCSYVRDRPNYLKDDDVGNFFNSNRVCLDGYDFVGRRVGAHGLPNCLFPVSDVKAVNVFPGKLEETYGAVVNCRFSFQDRGVDPVLGTIRFMSQCLVRVGRLPSSIVKAEFLDGRRATTEGTILWEGYYGDRKTVFVSRRELFHVGFVGGGLVARILARGNR